MHSAALLGLTTVSIFEIGKVFKGERELLQLAIGSRSSIKQKKGAQTGVEIALAAVRTLFGHELTIVEQSVDVAVIDLDALIAQLSSEIPNEYGLITKLPESTAVYKKISPYPYITRDIAVFVPSIIAQSQLEAVIDAHAGPLMVRCDLFDIFTKEGKTSYAFRLVFQSNERTLTDDEINSIMQKITEAMQSTGEWVVR